MDINITGDDLARLAQENPLAGEQLKRIALERLYGEALARLAEYEATPTEDGV